MTEYSLDIGKMIYVLNKFLVPQTEKGHETIRNGGIIIASLSKFCIAREIFKTLSKVQYEKVLHEQNWIDRWSKRYPNQV